jgi:hypothetical protein
MAYLFDQNIKRGASPALPVPSVEYRKAQADQLNNVLRLYFNQLDNVLRGIMATQASTVSVLAYRAVSATATVAATDFLVECTSGTFTVNLPTAVGIPGQQFEVKNSGAGTITVDPSGAETIDGASTKTLAQYDALRIMSNGTNWIIT